MFDTTFPPRDGYSPDGPLARAYAPEVETHSRAAKCTACAMRHVCITQGLDQSEVETLDAAVWATRAIRQSETLIRAGDAFRNIYSVRAGSFKTVVTHQNGMAQVAGFQFPGNVIGFDGLYSNRHEVTAIALEDSIACIMPFSLLERQCIESPALQHQVHVLMSAEIVRETGLMMLLGVMTAEQRVAAFLLNIAKRMRQRGYSASCFNLRMTREEIGSYLGLTIETVSLTLSRERAKAGAGIGVCEHD